MKYSRKEKELVKLAQEWDGWRPVPIQVVQLIAEQLKKMRKELDEFFSCDKGSSP